MLFSIIAMAPAGGGASGGGSTMMGLLPMILIFAVLYFFLLRPQAKRQKEQQNMLKELTKGDKIVTSGGIHCQILNVNEKDNTLLVKAYENVKLEIEIGAVARKIPSGGEPIKP